MHIIGASLYFEMVWAHLGSNQGPTGYEPVALPAELWARKSWDHQIDSLITASMMKNATKKLRRPEKILI